MRFWDTSALLPLIFEESTSEAMAGLYRQDSAVAVWWGTRVECVSAIARLARDGILDIEAERHTRRLLDILLGATQEVAAGEDVRARAERCLAVHPLRAADSLQLAAALIWTRERPSAIGFVSLDTRLRQAAAREGFAVLPES